MPDPVAAAREREEQARRVMEEARFYYHAVLFTEKGMPTEPSYAEANYLRARERHLAAIQVRQLAEEQTNG